MIPRVFPVQYSFQGFPTYNRIPDIQIRKLSLVEDAQMFAIRASETESPSHTSRSHVYRGLSLWKAQVRSVQTSEGHLAITWGVAASFFFF